MRAFIAYGTGTHTYTNTHREHTQQELHNLIKQNQAWPQQTAEPQSDTATERDTNKGYSFHAPGENKKK